MEALMQHIPVMRNEMIHYIQPRDGEIYVDGTFGAGGHTHALLAAANCRVFALDRDPDVEVFAEHLIAEFPGRLTFICGRFGEMARLLAARGVEKVNGILLDIGVSSMQLDRPERGFSFQKDGPLDMRMGRAGQDAMTLVNQAPEEEIADILFTYGGEKASRRIARAVVAARMRAPVTRTAQLAEIIRKAVRSYNDTVDPATRSFQALRIWVNDELSELTHALETAEHLLVPEGRLVVITFHSGEDAIVKRFLNERSGKAQGVSRHDPLPPGRENASVFSLPFSGALAPSEEEIRLNPRARSAKMRAAVRV